MRMPLKARSLLAVLAALLFIPAAAHAESGAEALNKVRTWAYQLKDVSQDKIDKIIASPFDMIIIDASMFPAGKEIHLTREQVESMKKKPDGSRRLVVSYFSAGECEDFRYYWKPEWNKKRPSWVYKADKDWKGDYIVRYWDPDWQRIIYGTPHSIIDKILDAGFDGISIDRVDAYYYFGDTNERRSQMVDLIKGISGYIRARKPDAVILAQNAEEILDNKDYIASIDGIAKEDLIYGISHTERRNPEGDIQHSTKLLDAARAAGKVIFVIEYLKDKAHIAEAREYMNKHDFVLYVGQRDLYELSGVVGDDGVTGSGKAKAP